MMKFYGCYVNKVKFIFTLILLLFLFTLDVAASDFYFATAADSRGRKAGVNEKVLSALMNHLVNNEKKAEFLLFPGDMISGSTESAEKNREELLLWKRIMSPVYDNPCMAWPKVWPSIGNHEVKHPEAEKVYLEVFQDVFFNGPQHEKGFTYSFDYKDVHFVALKTDHWNPHQDDDNMPKSRYLNCLDWLEKDLEAAKQRGVKHIFVFGHQPAFPVSDHIRDSLPQAQYIMNNPEKPESRRFLEMRDHFWALLKKHNVTAYITGHEHLYARQSVQGVFQVLTGGAGAPLRGVNPVYGKESRYNSKIVTYEDGLPYYKILGYPHGPGDNCQASPDFVGGRFFHYVLFHVTNDKITVYTYGIDPVEGSTTEIPEDYIVELKDIFEIIPKN